MKKSDTPVTTPKVVPNPGRINEDKGAGGATSGAGNDAQTQVPEAPQK